MRLGHASMLPMISEFVPMTDTRQHLVVRGPAAQQAAGRRLPEVDCARRAAARQVRAVGRGRQRQNRLRCKAPLQHLVLRGR